VPETLLTFLCDVIVLQPCRGEYPGANNLEDDYTIISNKVGYVGQEHGMTTATATMLAGVPNAGGATATAKLNGIVRSVGRAHNLGGWLLNNTQSSSEFALFSCTNLKVTPHVVVE
jgi:hypothetical protein